MKPILFFVGLILCVSSYAQSLDARDNLIFPVNPPKDGGATKNSMNFSISAESREALVSIVQTRSDLKRALDDGLAENHPTVKSLRAKLEALQSAISVSTTAKPKDKEKDLDEDMEQLRNELAATKAELQKLREELAKLKEK